MNKGRAKSTSQKDSKKSELIEYLEREVFGESSMDSSASFEESERKTVTGQVHFEVIQKSKANQPSQKDVQWLEDLVKIFQYQLPVMYAEDQGYISRLVHSREHRSLVLVIGDHVFGGVTFRTWKSKKFYEIAFFAVSYMLQGQGYGTMLMNRLKQLAQQEGIRTFLTYADNTAVGFFRKQGFTDNITLDSTKWKRFIKFYIDATLMQYSVTSSEEEPEWRPCTVCCSTHVTPFMICCDYCNSWCHGECVGVQKEIQGEWYCPVCRITLGIGSVKC